MLRRLLNKTTLTLAMAAALTSCQSAMIYESEKIALSIEAKPEVSQPISGTFGAKQRVVMIVPGRQTSYADSVAEIQAIAHAGANSKHSSYCKSVLDIIAKAASEEEAFSAIRQNPQPATSKVDQEAHSQVQKVLAKGPGGRRYW